MEIKRSISDDFNSLYSDSDESGSISLKYVEDEAEEDLDIEMIDKISEDGRVTNALEDYEPEG